MKINSEKKKKKKKSSILWITSYKIIFFFYISLFFLCLSVLLLIFPRISYFVMKERLHFCSLFCGVGHDSWDNNYCIKIHLNAIKLFIMKSSRYNTIYIWFRKNDVQNSGNIFSLFFFLIWISRYHSKCCVAFYF